MLKKLLNPVFFLHLIVVALVLLGIVPRQVVIYDVITVGIYLLFAPLEDGIIFFVRSIPLFIAIPLTASYDNLNMWRIFSIILFAKWAFSREGFHYIGTGLLLFFRKPIAFLKEHSWAFAMFILFILALASLWHAPNPAEGLKRIIYFINAALIGIVIAYPPKTKQFTTRLIRNIAIPVIIVTIVGVIQVASTYFIDIYQFMRIWGEGIQMREFGTVWSYIAVHVGNTWFAYFGNQLSLRAFSLFPDSHSFPIFLLLGLPAVFAWTLTRPIEKASRLKDMLYTRGKLAVLFVPLIFLMMILSGTRGIWAGGLAMIVWVPMIVAYLRYRHAHQEHKNIIKYLAGYFVLFFMLFFVAYPIFSSPQFLVSKGDSYLLQERFKSILDFGETSNSQRIDIWKKTLVSIEHHPVDGVGIGNFPVILDQNIRLSKAGSSAHNIYLQIAGEMGILALLVTLYFLWSLLKHLFNRFMRADNPVYRAYFGGLLITISWVLAYLMTDVAIFDERTLLLAIATFAIVSMHD
jgi:O-antigen ligase